MAKDNGKKHKHECPKMDPGPKITPLAYTGQSAEECRKMFRAWCRIVDAQRPRPRKSH